MLPRYTKPAMKELWSEEAKFRRWLYVECAVVKAKAGLGIIPSETAEKIVQHFASASIDVRRIEAIEQEVEHDMIAFIVAMQETMTGDLAPLRGEFHKGMTSYDIEDTALIVALRYAGNHILDALQKLQHALLKKSVENARVLMIARTHGQYAEPDTFGRLLYVYCTQIERSIARIEHALKTDLAETKLSGAVGTYGGLDWRIEEFVCQHFDLKPAKCETQILQRDRHAAFMGALVIAGSSIEQMCRTFWEMMRSDAKELEEPRKPKQRGSSAMPQKKNPGKTEQLQGLARLLRGMMTAALENIATPECRDISQSSVERHIWPDATAIIHYMAETAEWLVANLIVHKDRMEENLRVRSLGTWAAQRVRLALIEKGVDPNIAYEYVQKTAFEAEKTGEQLFLLLADRPVNPLLPTAAIMLGPEKLVECFDPVSYVTPGINHIFGFSETEKPK